MKGLIDKLTNLEKSIAAEGKPFDLFALFSGNEWDSGEWDLVVASQWINDDTMGALRYLNERLRTILTEEELASISKITNLDIYDPRVREIQLQVDVEHGHVELSNYKFYVFNIDKVHVITSKLQKNEQLMRSIWKIIVEFWQSGKKKIYSEEVLNEVLSQGIKPRDYAMDRALQYLIRKGCIKGPEFINAQGVKEHGAMAIITVNPKCEPF